MFYYSTLVLAVFSLVLQIYRLLFVSISLGPDDIGYRYPLYVAFLGSRSRLFLDFYSLCFL